MAWRRQYPFTMRAHPGGLGQSPGDIALELLKPDFNQQLAALARADGDLFDATLGLFRERDALVASFNLFKSETTEAITRLEEPFAPAIAALAATPFIGATAAATLRAAIRARSTEFMRTVLADFEGEFGPKFEEYARAQARVTPVASFLDNVYATLERGGTQLINFDARRRNWSNLLSSATPLPPELVSRYNGIAEREKQNVRDELRAALAGDEGAARMFGLGTIALVILIPLLIKFVVALAAAAAAIAAAVAATRFFESQRVKWESVRATQLRLREETAQVIAAQDAETSAGVDKLRAQGADDAAVAAYMQDRARLKEQALGAKQKQNADESADAYKGAGEGLFPSWVWITGGVAVGAYALATVAGIFKKG